MSWFTWRDRDLLLEIALQPGAKRSEWAGLHGERVKIRLQAPPIDGRANAQLIDFLSEHFALPKARITIERGLSSRQKRIRIQSPLYLPPALREWGLLPPG